MSYSPARFFALAGAFVVAMTLMLASPAFAQYPPAGVTDTTPDASFGCQNVVAGATATCTIGGYLPGSTVDVTVQFNDTAVLSESITADDTGFISYSFPVPADASDGSLSFSHSGTLFTGIANVQSGTASVSAAPAAVADTGRDINGMLFVALGALVLGAGALGTARRRQHHHVDA